MLHGKFRVRTRHRFSCSRSGHAHVQITIPCIGTVDPQAQGGARGGHPRAGVCVRVRPALPQRGLHRAQAARREEGTTQGTLPGDARSCTLHILCNTDNKLETCTYFSFNMLWI